MMHLPVSKVFISTTGNGRSRKEGKETEQSHSDIAKGYFNLISGLFLKVVFACNIETLANYHF